MLFQVPLIKGKWAAFRNIDITDNSICCSCAGFALSAIKATERQFNRNDRQSSELGVDRDQKPCVRIAFYGVSSRLPLWYGYEYIISDIIQYSIRSLKNN